MNDIPLHHLLVLFAVKLIKPCPTTLVSGENFCGGCRRSYLRKIFSNIPTHESYDTWSSSGIVRSISQ